MNFRNDQPIWQQICDHMVQAIATGRWNEDERIPSVRDLAVQLEVNPNTVMRAYERLTADALIYNRRGIGYFVAPDARTEARRRLHAAFYNELFRRMDELSIDLADIEREYHNRKTAKQ